VGPLAGVRREYEGLNKVRCNQDMKRPNLKSSGSSPNVLNSSLMFIPADFD
jgi:hypothetical protein